MGYRLAPQLLTLDDFELS